MQKIGITIIWAILTIIALFILYFFGARKDEKLKFDFENEILKKNKRIDSLHQKNKMIIQQIDSLTKKNNQSKEKEKIIIHKISTYNEKIENVKNISNTLPDTSNFRFFSEFKADTSQKR